MRLNDKVNRAASADHYSLSHFNAKPVLRSRRFSLLGQKKLPVLPN